jgi:hypothetical protein
MAKSLVLMTCPVGIAMALLVRHARAAPADRDDRMGRRRGHHSYPHGLAAVPPAAAPAVYVRTWHRTAWLLLAGAAVGGASRSWP